MSDLGGIYDFKVSTPMGEQSGTMTVVPNDAGTGFDGNLSGTLGSMDIDNGTISGNTLNWKMKMSMPMPMTLECEATIEGGTLAGNVNAGAFGAMPLTGEKVG